MYKRKRNTSVSIILLFTISLLGFSCQRHFNDLIDGKTVDERLSAALTEYNNVLTSAPYGWKFLQRSSMAYNGGAFDSIINTFTYYMKFDASNNVTMYGDFDTTEAATAKASTYRIKALQRPTLIFDTRTYIHVPSDPSPSVSKSPLDPGLGWGTDFQFAFADNTDPSQLGDTIHLKGIYNLTEAYMVKATKADQDFYTSGNYAKAYKIVTGLNSSMPTYWKRFSLNNTQYEISGIDFLGKTLKVGWVDGSNNFISKTINFYIGFDGSLLFNKPIVAGTGTISGFSNLSDFDGTQTNATVVGPNATVAIVPATKPIKVDSTAAQRWWNEAYAVASYWQSFSGFHANGADDGYNIKGLVSGTSTFYSLCYWPAYSPPYDLCGPIFLTSAGGLTLSYGSASNMPVPNTNYLPDGRLKFTSPGNFGTYPTTGAAASTRTLLYNTNGFYFVQVNDRTYDMISASDAKSWITWVR